MDGQRTGLHLAWARSKAYMTWNLRAVVPSPRCTLVRRGSIAGGSVVSSAGLLQGRQFHSSQL